MSEPLHFNEFPASTFDEWKKNVSRELGEQPLSTLDWKTELNIVVPPYFSQTEKSSANPNYSFGKNNWAIRQDVSVSNHEQCMLALKGGVEALGVVGDIDSKETLSRVLDGIFIEYISIHFIEQQQPSDTLKALIVLSQERGLELSALRGSVAGNVSCSQLTDEALLFLFQVGKALPHFKTLVINAGEAHQQGANAIQELAACLSEAHEVVHRLVSLGCSVSEIISALQFELVVGNTYFVEIGKLRALRHLWKAIVQQYDANHSGEVSIHAHTSSYHQTVYDMHNNLLRATTQAMSAVIGGANAVCVLPFDDARNSNTSGSLRWARNVQHLLREESYFHEVIDPAKGSYFVEWLEQQIINDAWSAFQRIEKEGGFSAFQVELKKEYAATHHSRIAALESGDIKRIGTNRFFNTKEKVDAELSSLRPHRLTASYEKQLKQS